MRLGIISDTHGVLRPEVFDAFAGVDQILHAGDVGARDLLTELGIIAPVTAVYGNTDGSELRGTLPRVATLQLDGFDIVITHGDQLGSPTPTALNAAFPDAQIIVFGHTHRPLLTLVDVVVTVMNPGSAGPRRFNLPPSVGILELEPGIPPRGRLLRCRTLTRSRSVLLSMLCLLQASTPGTVAIRSIGRPPAPADVIDSIHYGPPQLHIRTRQGVARVWFLRAADTFFVAATIPDSTRYWGDDFVVSLDTRGDGGDNPQHDDFQLYFRRTLDSSVVFRGRLGRWEPPKGDPDWRLGAERSGGGWEVSARDDTRGWSLLLRLDPAWLEGAEGRLPRVAVRIYDNDPQGWFAWPLPPGIPQPSSVEQTPDLWAPIR